MEDFLRNNLIAFTVYEAGPSKTGQVKVTFDVTPVIKIRFDFVGNPETGMLNLTIQNCGGLGKDGRLGKTKFVIPPSQVGPKLVEALIRYVLRKPNQLAMLVGSPQQTAKVAPKLQNSLLDLEEDLLTLLNKIAQEVKETRKETKRSVKIFEETERKREKEAEANEKRREAEAKAREEKEKDRKEFDEWIKTHIEQEARERATLFQWLVGLVGFKARTAR
jgi:hypothetical protein